VEDARLRGRVALAEELLAGMADLAEVPADLQALDAEVQPELREIFPDRERHLWDGEFLRVVTRYHQESVRLILAGNPSELTVEQIDRLVVDYAHLRGALESIQRKELALVPVVVDLAALATWMRTHPTPPGLGGMKRQLEGLIGEWTAGMIPVLEEVGDRQGLAWLLYEQARMRLAAGETREALADLRRAVDLLETRLTAAGASTAGARRLRLRSRPLYELLATTLVESGEAEAALEVLSRLQQVETRGSVREALVEGIPQGGDLRRAGALEARAEALEDQLATAPSSPGGPAALEVVQTLLASTRAEYYAVLKKLQEDVPELTRLAVRPLNFARLQAHIPADAAVVQLFPAEDRLYLFVVTNDDLKVRSVEIGREDLERLVMTAVRGLLQAARQETSAGDWSHPAVAPLREALVGLHHLIVEPVEGDLGDRRVVAFIPTGALTYLPFQALARERGEGGLEFLVERLRTVTVLKAVDLDQLVAPPPPRDRNLVAIGNPDGTLEAASREVRELGRLFPGSTLALRSEATTARLRQMCASRPSYVHLATHGTFSSHDPMESFLVMADGPLRLADIVGLQLGDANLVTLSACQSGIGEASPTAGEDVTTLAEAFWFAGGRSLLASMWSVSDESTRELMVEFYGQLAQGRSKAEALQAAQLRLLRSERFRAPYYWAPFVLLGDWR